MRRPRGFATLALLAIVLTACPSSPTVDPSPTSEPTATPTPTATGVTPVAGGRLVVAVRELRSLDPVRATSADELNVLAQLFQPLTTVDPVTNEVGAGAAHRWRVSKDGLTWTFFLAKGRFSTGEPVRARDFKFAFDRLARKSSPAQSAFQLEQIRGFDRAKYLGEPDQLTGVEAKRSRELVIRLRRPFQELAYHLAHPSLGPLPRDRFEARERRIAMKPIGNGPFRIADDAGGSLLLEPSRRWSGPAPLLDAVEFTRFKTIDAGWRAYRDGRVQVAEAPVSAITAGGTVYSEAGFTPFWTTMSFGFNLDRAVFAKAQVRRAISLAIDRDAIVARIYGNTRDPATGIVPPGVRAFRPDACDVCHLDRARARQIVEAAFGGKRKTISLDYFDERSARLLAKAIRVDLERVGFRVKLRAHSEARYGDILDRDEHGLAQLAWISEVPSPDSFLAQQLRTGHVNNHTGWSNRRFDAEIDKARKERSQKVRLNHYKRAEGIALEQMPIVPILFYRNRVAVSPDVQGLALHGRQFDAATVWLMR